jgi:hypothetical protein
MCGRSMLEPSRTQPYVASVGPGFNGLGFGFGERAFCLCPLSRSSLQSAVCRLRFAPCGCRSRFCLACPRLRAPACEPYVRSFRLGSMRGTIDGIGLRVRKTETGVNGGVDISNTKATPLGLMGRRVVARRSREIYTNRHSPRPAQNSSICCSRWPLSSPLVRLPPRW